MRSLLSRDGRRNRSPVVQGLIWGVLVLTYLWPWYILCTKRAIDGGVRLRSVDGRKLLTGRQEDARGEQGLLASPGAYSDDANDRESIVAFVGVQVRLHAIFPWLYFALLR